MSAYDVSLIYTFNALVQQHKPHRCGVSTYLRQRLKSAAVIMLMLLRCITSSKMNRDKKVLLFVYDVQ